MAGHNPFRNLIVCTGPSRRGFGSAGKAPLKPLKYVDGAGYRIRTRGPLITNQVLYQLS